MHQIPTIIFSKFKGVCMHVSPCCFPNQQSECKMARVTREIAWVGVTAQLEQHGSHLLIAPCLAFAHWNYRCLHNNSFVNFLKIPFHGEKKVFQAFKQVLKCRIMWKRLDCETLFPVEGSELVWAAALNGVVVGDGLGRGSDLGIRPWDCPSPWWEVHHGFASLLEVHHGNELMLMLLLLSIFSSPGQLNRWICHSLSQWLIN